MSRIHILGNVRVCTLGGPRTRVILEREPPQRPRGEGPSSRTRGKPTLHPSECMTRIVTCSQDYYRQFLLMPSSTHPPILFTAAGRDIRAPVGTDSLPILDPNILRCPLRYRWCSVPRHLSPSFGQLGIGSGWIHPTPWHNAWTMVPHKSRLRASLPTCMSRRRKTRHRYPDALQPNLSAARVIGGMDGLFSGGRHAARCIYTHTRPCTYTDPSPWVGGRLP